MIDDIEWAAADLEHASALYEQAIASNQPLSKTWQSQGYVWHIQAWHDVIPTPTFESPNATIPGLWHAKLTARGPSGAWSFAKSSDGWLASRHTQRF